MSSESPSAFNETRRRYLRAKLQTSAIKHTARAAVRMSTPLTGSIDRSRPRKIWRLSPAVGIRVATLDFPILGRSSRALICVAVHVRTHTLSRKSLVGGPRIMRPTDRDERLGEINSINVRRLFV